MFRSRRKWIMSSPKILRTAGSLLAAAVVTVPLSIAGLLVWDQMHRRRMQQLSKETACQQCGAVLGPESLRLADDEFKKANDELKEKYPLARFRMVRTFHAVCPKCYSRYAYVDKDQK